MKPFIFDGSLIEKSSHGGECGQGGSYDRIIKYDKIVIYSINDSWWYWTGPITSMTTNFEFSEDNS